MEQQTHRNEILGYSGELLASNIRPNPLNQRGKHQLAADDTNIAALSDSIVTTGQHSPIAVYQLVGHYKYPDEPGKYMLLQGERRWTAVSRSSLDTLRAIIFKTPETISHELELIGVEQAFKEHWGLFFEMRWAWNLAQELELDVRDRAMALRTGLTKDDLVRAWKVFSLDPYVINLVESYEQELYRQRTKGIAKNRLAGPAREKEFSMPKAVLVYDLAEVLFTSFSETVSQDYADVNALQRRIADQVCAQHTSVNDLDAFVVSLRAYRAADTLPPGMLASIKQFINAEASVRRILHRHGASEAASFDKAIGAAARLQSRLDKFTGNTDNIGHNLDRLREHQRSLYALARTASELERAIHERLRQQEEV